jgi:hypothetical protein
MDEQLKSADTRAEAKSGETPINASELLASREASNRMQTPRGRRKNERIRALDAQIDQGKFLRYRGAPVLQTVPVSASAGSTAGISELLPKRGHLWGEIPYGQSQRNYGKMNTE